MPRPCKRRRICALPCCGQFGPSTGGAGEPVVMTLDEYETVRLIDLEGMTQEECAVQMRVARTTAQAIYRSARSKLAECLVRGRELSISGGDYVLCDGRTGCGRRCCREPHQKEEQPMKIAVTYENGEIFQHFGHSEHLKLYTVENGAVQSASIAEVGGSGHGALVGLLQTLGADTLICGGIGGGAREALEAAGIRLYGGVSGSADEAVQALLAGTLDYDPDVRCSHHDQQHGGEHSCGQHGCGGHDAGGRGCGGH